MGSNDTPLSSNKSETYSPNNSHNVVVSLPKTNKNEDISLRDLLQLNIKRPQVSQDFIQSIKDKIRLA